MGIYPGASELSHENPGTAPSGRMLFYPRARQAAYLQRLGPWTNSLIAWSISDRSRAVVPWKRSKHTTTTTICHPSIGSSGICDSRDDTSRRLLNLVAELPQLVPPGQREISVRTSGGWSCQQSSSISSQGRSARGPSLTPPRSEERVLAVTSRMPCWHPAAVVRSVQA